MPPIRVGALSADVMAEIRAKSKNALYRRDPEAWVYDVLGGRWHKAQREAVNGFMTSPRTLVKSGNGSGKSRMVSELITWGVAVHEPGELICICSAPTERQVRETTFAYLGKNINAASARGFDLPGKLGDALKWNYRARSGVQAQTLVIGLKPSDNNVVGTFQGIRAMGVPELGLAPKTWVFLDEAGGVPSDLFTAAAAVTTGGGGNNKVMGIGNPDQLGNEFHHIFTDPKLRATWSVHTISVLDLPTITGEIVYPEDPAKQEEMLLSGMNDQAWVDQAKIAWGEGSARYRSKVLGEFPDADDHSFFSQTAMDRADDTVIDTDAEAITRLGVDVARFGEDDSMAYLNNSGHIRKVATWSKASTVQSAAKIHELALEHGVHEVVIDAAGVGAGVYDNVMEIPNRTYTVVGTLGAYASPEPKAYINARAYWFDKFREAMMKGEIDLDLTNDEQLKKEMLALQFDFSTKSQIKIESKADMKARGVDSPDALDAVIYSYINEQMLSEAQKQGLNKGEVAHIDPMSLMVESMEWLPI